MSDWTRLEALELPRRRAMAFLRRCLPASDLDCYPFGLFLQFADHALSLRERAPWCGALEEEIFLHYVLFPRVNDEDLSFHRALFFDALWPRVRDLPAPEERVLAVNRWCHENASYQLQDDRTASPLTVFRCGSGRCGEQSAFLVSALRSVGIPARQVYAPRWSHCDDNHAWVEALCDGRWRFLGACEPEPVLDRGWFNTAAARAMLVHSRLFGEGRSPLHGPAVGGDGAVSYYNQTARYAPTRPYTFQALLGDAPAPGARFRLQILNESGYHTIASLTAGEDGRAQAELGLGDLHVLASLDGLLAEGDCAGGAVTLRLAPPTAADTPRTSFDFRAPAAPDTAPAGLSEALRARRSEVLSRGNALRAARLASLAPPPSPWADLLAAARGNAGEIRAFLSGENAPNRVRFLRTLSDKDLRDASLPILEDHFTRLLPRSPDTPEDVYWAYTACPRIALEPLTAWREPLLRHLAGWTGSPAALWSRLEEELEVRSARLYANLYCPPDRALAAGGCDGKSLRVLLIACLRALGVPARLRPLDGEPEIWREGGFQPIRPQATGVLQLLWSGETTPLYRQNWTLSRRTADGWQLLDAAGERWQDAALALTLPAGCYRLLLSTRLPNGNQFALRQDVILSENARRALTLRPRPFSLEDALCCQDLPALPARTLDGRETANLFQCTGPALFVWLEEGGEPTEHVLNELLDSPLGQLPIAITFLLRGRDGLDHPTLSRVLERLPRIRVLLDDWGYDLELMARQLSRDPSTPPLAVVCDGGGRAVYSVSGYQAGSVELLARVAAHLCKRNPS